MHYSTALSVARTPDYKAGSGFGFKSCKGKIFLCYEHLYLNHENAFKLS